LVFEIAGGKGEATLRSGVMAGAPRRELPNRGCQEERHRKGKSLPQIDQKLWGLGMHPHNSSHVHRPGEKSP